MLFLVDYCILGHKPSRRRTYMPNPQKTTKLTEYSFRQVPDSTHSLINTEFCEYTYMHGNIHIHTYRHAYMRFFLLMHLFVMYVYVSVPFASIPTWLIPRATLG